MTEANTATAGIAFAGSALYAGVFQAGLSPVVLRHVDAPRARAMMCALRTADGIVRAAFARRRAGEIESVGVGVDELIHLCMEAGRQLAQAVSARRCNEGWVLGPAVGFAVSVVAPHWQLHGQRGLDECVSAMCEMARSNSFMAFADGLAGAPSSFSEDAECCDDESVRWRLSIAQAASEILPHVRAWSFGADRNQVQQMLMGLLVSAVDTLADEQIGSLSVGAPMAMAWRQATLLRLARMAGDAYKNRTTHSVSQLRSLATDREKAELIAGWKHEAGLSRILSEVMAEALQTNRLVDDYAQSCLMIGQQKVSATEPKGDAA